MKKLLLGILLGMLLHKSINYLYEHEFSVAFYGPQCKEIMIGESGTLTDRIRCAVYQMGPYRYLAYVLIRPSGDPYSDNFWVF
jgi:hypothetical protein